MGGISLFIFNWVNIDEYISIKKDPKYLIMLSLVISIVKPCCEELYWHIKTVLDIIFFVLYQLIFYQIFI